MVAGGEMFAMLSCVTVGISVFSREGLTASYEQTGKSYSKWDTQVSQDTVLRKPTPK